MELKGHAIGFKGEYTATVLKADGTVKEFLNEEKTLRSGDVIKNLLLDNFFERLTSLALPFSLSGVCVRVGTGTSPVSASQQSLSNQLVLNSGSWPFNSNFSQPNASIEGDKLKAVLNFTFNFSLGQVQGNISELGIDFSGNNSGSATLIHSRALVVDSAGNPTTISVSSSEQLVLNYSLRLESSAADLVENVNMLFNGQPESVEVRTRWYNFLELRSYIHSNFSISSGDYSVFNGPLNGIGTNPSGSSSTVPSGNKSYSFNVSGGKQTTYGFPTLNGNLTGGISALVPVINNSTVKFGFNPPIPKNSDRTLSITVRQTFGRLP